jgi:hypothetical protein
MQAHKTSNEMPTRVVQKQLVQAEVSEDSRVLGT